MKKSIMSLALLALVASSPASAASTVGGTNHWAASADIAGSTVHAGIVVTDSTYAGCAEQFSNALASHEAMHGDVFTNVHNCHYVSPSFGGIAELHQELNYVNGGNVVLPPDVQIALEDKFIKDMSALEDEYHVSEFLQKRDALIEQYILKTQPKKKVLK